MATTCKFQFPTCVVSPTPVEGGIYAITNNSNGKIYIGSAISFRKRWNTHKHCFSRGTQENQYLQRAFNKSPESFEIFIVESLLDSSKENMLLREQFWMDFYRSYIPECGYNLSPTAGSCRGYKMTQDQIEKMSKRLKGRKLSPEHILKLKGRKPWNKGISPSVEQIERQRSKVLGRKQSLEWIKNSIEGRKRAKSLWRKVVQIDFNGNKIKTFDCIKIAAIELGFPRSRYNIGAVCRGVREHAIGYKWEYAN